MMWWPKRGESAGEDDSGQGTVRWAVADFDIAGPDPVMGSPVVPRQCGPVVPVTPERLADALEQVGITYVRDADGAFVAMWERHAVLFAVEGPSDEILVVRARAHTTVPADWSSRAYMVVNEWNHARRFGKAYVGDVNGLGELPIYAEVQVPLGAGVHAALLVELVESAVSASDCFVEWLHDGGGLL